MAIKQLNAMMSVNPNQANCGTAPAFTVTVAVTLEADSVGGAYAVYIYDHENFPWFDVLLEEKLNIAYPDGPAFNFQQHPLTLDCTANCFVKGTKGNSNETNPEIYAYVKEIGGNRKTFQTDRQQVKCVPAKEEEANGEDDSSEPSE